MDGLEQAGARPAGAQAAQFVLERRIRALHAALEVGKIEFRQGRHRWTYIFGWTGRNVRAAAAAADSALAGGARDAIDSIG